MTIELMSPSGDPIVDEFPAEDTILYPNSGPTIEYGASMVQDLACPPSNVIEHSAGSIGLQRHTMRKFFLELQANTTLAFTCNNSCFSHASIGKIITLNLECLYRKR